MLRDIYANKDTQIRARARVIADTRPSILLLTNFDYDHRLLALNAFAEVLSEMGMDYPVRFAWMPNAGLSTGLDLDGDGRRGRPDDNQGYGEFGGHGGMAILSTIPIDFHNAIDLSGFLWKDLPDNSMHNTADETAQSVQKLASKGIWDIPFVLSDGQVLRLLAFHANTPAFDGPDGRNAQRNHDEVAFWQHYLDGSIVTDTPTRQFAIVGDANLDPFDGLGQRDAISALINHPQLQDPKPRSARGTWAAAEQGGVNASHKGDPAMDTADWWDTPDGPGNLRVDYVLPSVDLHVAGSGVAWPEEQSEDQEYSGSVHGLVWVDLELEMERSN